MVAIRVESPSALQELKHRAGNVVRDVATAPDWYRLWRSAAGETDGVARLAGAVLDARRYSPSPSEAARLDAIERLRRSLAVSEELVTFEDFGAVCGDAPVSPEAMEAGQTRSVPMREVVTYSKPARLAYLLFRLVREFGPRTAVEMGTCVGISAAYQLAALAENGGGGRFVSMEGSRVLAGISAENLARLGYGDFEIVTGRHQDTLPAVLAANRPVDFVFVDGDHAEHTTREYQRLIMESASDTAIVYHDDIRWSDGMSHLWAEICSSTEDIAAIVDLYWVGVLLVQKGYRGAPRRFNLHYPF